MRGKLVIPQSLGGKLVISANMRGKLSPLPIDLIKCGNKRCTSILVYEGHAQKFG
jgi:hypothetical protein